MFEAVATFGRTHRVLHWLTVGLMLAVFPVGVAISSINQEALKYAAYDFHKWFGVCILLITSLRLSWRILKPVYPAADINRFELLASGVTHLAIYGFLFALPLLGWAATNALGFEIVWFWVAPLPKLLPRNPELGFFLLEVHQWMAWAFIAVLVLHVTAALFHHFIKKDSVLGRMIEFRV